jgi:hypothetical protein
MDESRASEDHRATFEETYPRYEFAPLVAIALALGNWLAGQRNRARRAPPTRVRTPEATGPAAHAS